MTEPGEQVDVPVRELARAMIRAERLEAHLRAVIAIVDRVGGYMAPEHQNTLRLAKDALDEVPR